MTDRTELTELLDDLDFEFWLDRQGIDYRPTTGSRGAQFNVRQCPACGADKWKVYINQDTGLGNCFSGSCTVKTFNKFSFIRAVLGLSNSAVVEHIKSVAVEQGWRPPKRTLIAVENPNKLVIPESFELPHNGKNVAYLHNRGISKDIARYFRLRYCHQGAFYYNSPDGARRAMSFAGRIIIPIYDLDGNLVSFQGRDITGAAEKKYLFPPGFASTGVHLFNGHNVVNTERVVIGEGVFDVMAQKIALDEDPALRDVVPIGTFGKHLSHGMEDDQLTKFIRLRERGVKEAVLMWDGEVTATCDAVRAGMLLKGIGLKVRLAMLPKDKDPNEVPPSIVRKAFYEAKPLTGASGLGMVLKRMTG